MRVLVLNSLKLIAKVLKKDENKQLTLPIIIAATEDKSWRVRLSLSKLFSEVYLKKKQKQNKTINKDC